MIAPTETQQDELCNILKAYIGEWGAEYVIVSLPKSWQSLENPVSLGRCMWEFTTYTHISIRVEFEGRLQVFYSVSLIDK